MPISTTSQTSGEVPKQTQTTNDSMLVDPEEDALDALQTIKGYIRSDLSESDAALISDWQNLDEYVLELCGQSLEHLAREPESLAQLCVRFQSQLEDVSCGNYRALIESFECAGAVREGVSDVRTRLDELVAALPKLAAATRDFSKSVVAVQRERERQLRTAAEAARVLEILDMPRLMRALVKGELYDEALELRDHALKLKLMHPDEALIQSVCSEMDVLTQQMILQLLIVLRGPVQLPVCLRIVGFLRRLDVFTEFRLRMIFLQCRGEWMRNSMDQSTGSTPQARLVSLSDGTRAMVFEIITQYRAVFSDDGMDEYSALPHVKSDTSPLQATAILFDWASSCISAYLTRLESGLRDICDGAALNTVLQQAMYCGHSLGRVGADFRAALPPLFEATVLRIYSSHLAAARRQFETMLEDHRWAPVGSSAFRRDRSVSVSGQNKANGSPGDSSADGMQYNPPLAVLDSPPLAVFLNGILAALNELRLCAPVALGKRLGAVLEDTVIEAARFMSAIGGPGGVFLKRADRPHFVAMISSLRDLCLPHAARCLDFCMGQTNLARVGVVTDQLAEIFGEISPHPVRARKVKEESKIEEPNGTLAGGKDGTSVVTNGDDMLNVPIEIEGLAGSSESNGMDTGNGNVELPFEEEEDADVTEAYFQSSAKDSLGERRHNSSSTGPIVL